MVFVTCSGYKTLVHIKKIRISCLKVDIGPKNHTFMTFICRNTTLDCSKNVYVFYLCSLSMYSIYVVHLCSPSMQSIYAVHLCMYSIYENQAAKPEFHNFKIALNRVLTLPDYRSRLALLISCGIIDFENKNISVVTKH